MTPSALALSPAGDRLFVTCSDANAVAVVDVTEERSNVLGFVPTGWYPTAARALADGRLVVLNGRGGRSHPNPQGPNPAKKAAPAHEGLSAVQYVGRIQTGTVSLVDSFQRRATRRSHQDRHVLFAIPRHHAVRRGRARRQPRTHAPQRSNAHRARHLHRQGEPHLRPGLRRPQGRQRRSVAGAVRRAGRSQPPQAGARVRAAGQLLREFGRERRRAQLVHRRHRAGLRAEAVAQQLRRAPPPLRLRRPGARHLASGRLSLDQRRGGGHFHAQLRLLREQPSPRRSSAESRRMACAIPFSPPSPT